MSYGQEFYAATVDEAVDKASTALGVPRDRLDFEVQDEGSTGFLGIGARDARIVVERPEKINGERPALEEENRTLEYSEVRQTHPIEEETQEAVPILEDNGLVAEEVPEDLIVAIDEFVIALVEAMGLDATVDAYDAGDTIAVDVATKETGLFIGQKGETIDAIQYLLNVAIYKNRPFVKRIVVDSEGYRQRRTEAIQGMAHRTARRVLREKRSLSLPPMTAAERRVVHLFLKENPNVTTSSEGKEESRRVIVRPIL